MQNKQSKRTSHFYKKKLIENNKQQKENQQQNQIKPKKLIKISKRPKQAKQRAKQARQRKKTYVSRLQKKIDQLTKELERQKAKSVIKSHNSAFIKAQINKNQQNNQTQLTDPIYLKGIQSQFGRLYKAVQQKSQVNTQLCVQNLRQKFGIGGNQRKKWIKLLFNRMVQILMPMHCRLLLQYCQNSQEFYKLLGGSESLKQFRKFYFDTASKNIILQSRPIMVEIKQEYQKILFKIQQTQNQIFEKANKLQGLIDKIENSMNSLFVGRILVNLDIQRRQQTLSQIFPVNFYKNCQIKTIQNRMKSQMEHKQIELKQIMQSIQNYQNDYLIFDQLFRTC